MISRSHRPALCFFLTLLFAVDGKSEIVTLFGNSGSNGLLGNSGDPGQNGGDGGTGSGVTHTQSTSDPSNRLDVTGGNGGNGGGGGSAFSLGFSGGNGGRGGDGGDGNGSSSSSGVGQRESRTQISGGNGGAGGYFGIGNGASNGSGGQGGHGGAAQANSTASSTTGNAFAYADSGGGNGGIGAIHGNGGDGGSADAIASATSSTGNATASAGIYSGFAGDGLGTGNGGLGRSQTVNGAIASANANNIAAARVDVYGGNGGSSEAGNASHGGNADVTDAVSATTSASGTINLSQSVGAGHGGNTQSGQVGSGGSAVNELSVTTNVQRLDGYFITEAGSGGNRTNTSGTAGNAGNSTSSMEMTNTGDVDFYLETGISFGGDGRGGASGGNGGTADIDVTLQSTTGYVFAEVRTDASAGGATEPNGNAGNAGGGTVNVSVAAKLDATGKAYSFGGEGGNALGNSNGGNSSYLSTQATVTTDTGHAFADVISTGGQGGATENGTGGLGIDVSLTNRAVAVSGQLGTTHASQEAYGGGGGTIATDGVAPINGVAGNGGMGESHLSAINNNQSSTLSAFASGGDSGLLYSHQGTAGVGGNAIANSSLTNSGISISDAIANGGLGSLTGFSSTFPYAGKGGSASSNSSSLSLNADATSTAYSQGGTGGRSTTVNDIDGTGGNASAISVAESQEALSVANSRATAQAGYGFTTDNQISSTFSGTATSQASSISLLGTANATAESDGRVATARATASGQSGSVTAKSSTTGVSFDDSTSDAIRASNTVVANVGSTTTSSSFTANDGTIWDSLSVDADAFSVLTLSPSASAIDAALASHTNIMAAIENYSVIGLGQFGGGFPVDGSGLHSFNTQTVIDFDETFYGRDLILSFFELETSGSGFSNLLLSVSLGTFSQSWSFTDLGLAQQFFDENTIALGSVMPSSSSLDLSVQWQSSSVSDQFASSYAVSASAVPEPTHPVALITFMIAGWRMISGRRRQGVLASE